MKKVFLLTAISFSLLNANAQSKKAYAITSDVKGSYNWVTVKEIDLGTGEVIRTVFDPNATNNVSVKNLDGQPLARYDWTVAPTFSGVAAAAFDEKNNRLYFTNMRGHELRYFDLKNNQVSVVVNTDQEFNTGVKTEEANVITRMVIGADGNGYALTNDGNNLVRFSTEGKPVITKLGALIDDSKNGNVSIHNQCTSWGGDMIADSYGNLYVFTMRGHVFKVNIASRVADHIGTITGLPANFTINGTAVDANGDVLLSSATLTDNYYRINLGTLKALPMDKKVEEVWNASDLASSNIAYRNSLGQTPPTTEIKGNDVISIFPNPVASSFFNVSFEKITPGKYTIELTDASGRKVVTQVADIKGVQNQKITIPQATAGGIYLVRVLSADGKSVFQDKIVVQ
jgi:methionine-rich copper-binding protein CopC